MLKIDPKERLGTKGGADEILTHPWLININSFDIEKRLVDAPFKPDVSEDPFDVSQFDAEFTGLTVKPSNITQKDKKKVQEN